MLLLLNSSIIKWTIFLFYISLHFLRIEIEAAPHKMILMIILYLFNIQIVDGSTLSSPFAVDNLHPFPLTNSLKNIKLVSQDSTNRIWVVFQDLSAIRYSADLTTQTSPTIIDVIPNEAISNLNFFSLSSVTANFSYYVGPTLTNTSASISSKIATISSSKYIHILGYENLILTNYYIQSNNTIIDHLVLPITHPYLQNCYILITVYNTSVAITGFINQTQITMNSIINQNITAVHFASETWTVNGVNNISVCIRQFIGFVNGSVNQVKTTINMIYHTNNTVAWSLASTFETLFSLSNPIRMIVVPISAFDYVFAQDSSNHSKIFGCILNNVYYDSTTPNVIFHSFFKIGESPYFVSENIIISLTNSYLSWSATTISYSCPSGQSSCLLSVIPGSLLTFGYFTYILTPNLYKVSPCTGQFTKNGSSCISYTCSDTYCTDCSLSTNMCSTCGSPGIRSQNIMNCIVNSSNTTAISNSTNSTTICNISNCFDCQNNSCITCNSGYFLVNGICDISCNVSYCLSCNVSNICATCQADYTLNSQNQCTINTAVATPSNSNIDKVFNCEYLTNPDDSTLCKSFLNSTYAYFSVMINQCLISTPAIGQIIGWLSPLLAFNSDYWYYVYHNRTYQNLLVTHIFLKTIGLVNSQRMIPVFVSQTNQIQSIFSGQIEMVFQINRNNYTESNVLEIDQESTYFIHNIHKMLLWNYTISILLVIAFRCISRFVDMAANNCQQIFKEQQTSIHFNHQQTSSDTGSGNGGQNKSKSYIIMKILKFCNQNSTLTFLCVSLLESNAIFICFYAGLQLKLPFQVNFFDKLNLIITLLFLFCCILSGLALYPYLWRFKVQYSRTLIDEKKQCSQSYYSQTWIVIIRNSCFGFLQGIVLNNYTSVISLLAMMKLLLLINYVKNSKIYEFKAIFILNVSYIGFGLMYDLLLLFSYLSELNNWTVVKMILARQGYILQLCFLSGVIISTILFVLAKIVLSVYSVVKSCKTNNIVNASIFAVQKRSLPDLCDFKSNKCSSKIQTVNYCNNVLVPKRLKIKKINKDNQKKGFDRLNILRFNHSQITDNIFLHSKVAPSQQSFVGAGEQSIASPKIIVSINTRNKRSHQGFSSIMPINDIQRTNQQTNNNGKVHSQFMSITIGKMLISMRQQ